MDFEQIYKEESGFDIGKIHEIGTVYYSDDYVKWLEEKLLIQRVVGQGEQLCVNCKRAKINKGDMCDGCIEMYKNF